MPLNPGTRLGPYEIVAPLGAGGMGEVYRADQSIMAVAVGAGETFQSESLSRSSG